MKRANDNFFLMNSHLNNLKCFRFEQFSETLPQRTHHMAQKPCPHCKNDNRHVPIICQKTKHERLENAQSHTETVFERALKCPSRLRRNRPDEIGMDTRNSNLLRRSEFLVGRFEKTVTRRIQRQKLHIANIQATTHNKDIEPFFAAPF